QVLKTTHSMRGGKMCLVRVLNGEIADGMVLRSPDGKESKVSGIFAMNGTEAAKRGTAGAGETVGLGKIEAGRTGDTLYAADGKADAGGRRRLASLPSAEPVMALAVAARERGDDVRLSSALARIIEEDPSLRVT